MSLTDNSVKFYLAAAGAGAAIATIVYRVLNNPSRPFNSVETVGQEYDKWASDGILEHYWGEHIHLGYYTAGQRSCIDPHRSFISNFISASRAGLLTSEFKEAKVEFTRNLLAWSGVGDLSGSKDVRVLDVGCGIGGTTRLLARDRPGWTVTGVSISPAQVSRATELALDQGVINCDFRCCDAMNMPFPDKSFDVVWSCESAEHMPDKLGFIKECVRVLKPGGTFVMATWCQRDNKETPFSPSDLSRLDFLYREWCHPKFESIREYMQICESVGLEKLSSADWTCETIFSWRHSVFVGMWSPWAVICKPRCWWSTIREIVTLERMHTAFRDGLMQYGIIRANRS